MKDLIETEALVNAANQDSRLMQNLPKLLTQVVDRLVAEGNSTLCTVTMSLMTRLLKQVVEENGKPYAYIPEVHGQSTVSNLCQASFRCLTRTALYALLRAMEESTEGGWVDLTYLSPPDTPAGAPGGSSSSTAHSGRTSTEMSATVC